MRVTILHNRQFNYRHQTSQKTLSKSTKFYERMLRIHCSANVTLQVQDVLDERIRLHGPSLEIELSFGKTWEICNVKSHAVLLCSK